jgi:hypothetical protein
MRTDRQTHRQTDITKLVAAFRNSWEASKKAFALSVVARFLWFSEKNSSTSLNNSNGLVFFKDAALCLRWDSNGIFIHYLHELMLQNVEAQVWSYREKRLQQYLVGVMALVASNKENKLTCTRYTESGCSFYRCVLSLYTFLLRLKGGNTAYWLFWSHCSSLPRFTWNSWTRPLYEHTCRCHRHACWRYVPSRKGLDHCGSHARDQSNDSTQTEFPNLSLCQYRCPNFIWQKKPKASALSAQ